VKPASGNQAQKKQLRPHFWAPIFWENKQELLNTGSKDIYAGICASANASWEPRMSMILYMKATIYQGIFVIVGDVGLVPPEKPCQSPATAVFAESDFQVAIFVTDCAAPQCGNQWPKPAFSVAGAVL